MYKAVIYKHAFEHMQSNMSRQSLSPGSSHVPKHALAFGWKPNSLLYSVGGKENGIHNLQSFVCWHNLNV